MSDIRARLAEALREHFKLHRAGRPEEWVCGGCHADFHNFRCHEDHVADVLLSLEGVAIVALPEPTAAGNFPTQEVEDPLVWQVRATRAGSTPLVSYGEKLMPAWYARRLAAALLAAADAAEAATDA